MKLREIIASVRGRAGLPTSRQAERALRATLGALASALAEDDVRALSQALPRELGRSLAPRAGGAVETIEDLYAEAGRRERVGPGFAREHAQSVLEVLATALGAERVDRLRKHLPPDIAARLEPRRGPEEEPPPYVRTHPAHGPTPAQTLSRSRPGPAEPIAETRHELAHAGSVARSDAPHVDRMVETARSTRPAREDETLASAPEEARRR